MTIWPPTRRDLARPVYRALAQHLVRAIEAGELKQGDRLPTQRALAFGLGVSVQTVGRAYDELARQGVISSHVGRGCFVLSKPAAAPLPWHRAIDGDGVIDLSMLVPVTSRLHAACMSEALKELAAGIPERALFSFRPREALVDHCDTARGWLAECGLNVSDRDRILPTNGNTPAMTCALMTAAMPGDLVVADEIGHHTLGALTASLGLKLGGLAMDAEGILPDAFERACAKGPVRVIYLMPAGVGPTAALMGPERRRDLVAIARRHEVWIVENDAWGPLEPDRQPPVAELAPERTFCFTGLSKCVMPGLRIAWLVLPAGRIRAARTLHMVTNWMATPLVAEIASRWIERGVAEHLLGWQRARLHTRNMLAARVLEGIPHAGLPRGMHVWLPLPEDWPESAFVTRARQNGVAIAAGSDFATDGTSRIPGVRVSLGAGSEAELEDGLRILARLIRHGPGASV